MDLNQIYAQLERLNQNIEKLLPKTHAVPDFEKVMACRWVDVGQNNAYLEPINRPNLVLFEDLKGIDRQKEAVILNTRQFVNGFDANNILLTGSRGTGKSSLIKACLNAFAPAGLRAIEIDKEHLSALPTVLNAIENLPFRFIIFCDDLSFEAGDPSYKPLKAILDGSLNAPPDNVLIYASSNRRHLLPESMKDNLGTRIDEEGELHHSEAVEEKISLSERFGLWLTFYPFSQIEYLAVVESWLKHLGNATLDENVRTEALQYAIIRGSRSGRVAHQFARNYVGLSALKRQDLMNQQK